MMTHSVRNEHSCWDGIDTTPAKRHGQHSPFVSLIPSSAYPSEFTAVNKASATSNQTDFAFLPSPTLSCVEGIFNGDFVLLEGKQAAFEREEELGIKPPGIYTCNGLYVRNISDDDAKEAIQARIRKEKEAMNKGKDAESSSESSVGHKTISKHVCSNYMCVRSISMLQKMKMRHHSSTSSLPPLSHPHKRSPIVPSKLDESHFYLIPSLLEELCLCLNDAQYYNDIVSCSSVAMKQLHVALEMSRSEFKGKECIQPFHTLTELTRALTCLIGELPGLDSFSLFHFVSPTRCKLARPPFRDHSSSWHSKRSASESDAQLEELLTSIHNQQQALCEIERGCWMMAWIAKEAERMATMCSEKLDRIHENKRKRSDFSHKNKRERKFPVEDKKERSRRFEEETRKEKGQSMDATPEIKSPTSREYVTRSKDAKKVVPNKDGGVESDSKKYPKRYQSEKEHEGKSIRYERKKGRPRYERKGDEKQPTLNKPKKTEPKPKSKPSQKKSVESILEKKTKDVHPEKRQTEKKKGPKPKTSGSSIRPGSNGKGKQTQDVRKGKESEKEPTKSDPKSSGKDSTSQSKPASSKLFEKKKTRGYKK
eukprot:gnl/Carplike_NY0171/2976_a4003_401.p1 GENE.gnl/Carplike_NY0171/2976_a4003_401~~gnl/Carplike_NY0171/2976_a4003_401.p1  ORF type:complete len:595 (-),score=147.72 gnl/Carplike_NY0171/2976_a4003_401:160-1944(-)